MRTAGFLILPVASMLAACSLVQETDISPGIASMDTLSIHALRERNYGSSIEVEKRLPDHDAETLIASYSSDGLRVYTRIDVPAAPMPDGGYPVVVFVHGWIGVEGAPGSDFYIDEDNNNYNEMIALYAGAGFAVFTPGWRGHGTVDGVPADGIEFMEAWDNGSYLSPAFYAIDVLNLIDSFTTFDGIRLDLDNVNLVAHSQGGDVALIALAIAGEGSGVRTAIASASIWAGCFPSRFTQLETYEAMQRSPQAFLSGDGSWNGTATGASGEINRDFVFGYPADWIETPVVDEWTWQSDLFSLPTVASALERKLDQMYSSINSYVADIDDAEYELHYTDGGATHIVHDERVRDGMAGIDAFYMEEYLTEPLALQHSDRDFYSLSEWNADLCARVNQAGGSCHDFEYVGNTHSLRVSENLWFSGEHAAPGFHVAIQRDIALFNGERLR